jgi:hypothetical protein
LKWIVNDDPLKSVASQESTEAELMTLLHKAGLG